MYYVYCLFSHKNSKFHYYGFTSNLQLRLKAHKAGKVRTTRRFLPIDLLGYVEFKEMESALNFEKELKTKASIRKSFVANLQDKYDNSSGSPA